MNEGSVTRNILGWAVLLRGGRIGGISVYFQYVKLEIPSGDVKLYSSKGHLWVGDGKNNLGVIQV